MTKKEKNRQNRGGYAEQAEQGWLCRTGRTGVVSVAKNYEDAGRVRMDKTELDEIRARAEKATPGIWKWEFDPALDVFIGLGSSVSSVIEQELWDDGYRGFAISSDDAAFIAAARQDIPRLLDALDEELARNDLFSRCLHRALKLWQQQHPEAEHWPDGADNIVWLLDEVERLRAELERERKAANNLLARLASYAYKTAGQTLPDEIGEAIFEFEMERVGDERGAR